jgi:uncharacterized membrane protein YGL010W
VLRHSTKSSAGYRGLLALGFASPWLAAVALMLFVLGVVASIFSFYTPNWQGLWVALGALLVGLLLQVIGYFIEGRRAVLRDDISKVFFTPVSLASLLLFRLKLHRQLRDEVNRILAQINQFKQQ